MIKRGFQVDDTASIRKYDDRTREFITLIELPRESLGDLERELVNKTGQAFLSNHTIYEIKGRDGAVLCLWVHDTVIRFGHAV